MQQGLQITGQISFIDDVSDNRLSDFCLHIFSDKNLLAPEAASYIFRI